MSCSPIRAISAGAEPEAAALWRWHATEEIEHKGVAYDTWLHATRDWPRGKRWKVKAKVMLLVTRNFIVDRTQGSLELLRQDGITGPKAWARLVWYMWVRPGMMRKIFSAWAKFFLPGFHPWNEDDRHLIRGYEAGEDSAFDSSAEGAGGRRSLRRQRLLPRFDQPAQPVIARRDRFGAARAAVARPRLARSARSPASQAPGPTPDCRRSASLPAAAA